MVVTAGAREANAEKQLRGSLGQALWIADDRRSVIVRSAVIIGGGIGKRTASGRQELADDFVPRRVAFDVAPQPLTVDVAPLDLNRQPIRAQHVEPFVRQKIGELRP